MQGEIRQRLQAELDASARQGLWKGERDRRGPQGARDPRGRRASVLNFCANNYLGLPTTPS